MATMKKPAKKMQMGGGTKPMMKKGGSFPDLNKDGKITKADILKGRGVIAKKGMKMKKAQNGVKTLDANPPSPSGLTFGKKAGARKTAKAKGEYESSSNPKVEYNVVKRKTPGGTIGGQNVSMDTTGMAAGKKRFPVKVKMRSGKDVYYETNRSQAKGAVRVSKQKMGGKTKKCMYGCK